MLSEWEFDVLTDKVRRVLKDDPDVNEVPPPYQVSAILKVVYALGKMGVWESVVWEVEEAEGSKHDEDLKGRLTSKRFRPSPPRGSR